MFIIHWGEFLTLCLMAIALGMDAFSVSIGLGMQGLRLRQVMKISLLIGFFHMIMPLLGIMIGRYLSAYMGSLTVTIGGILLILFGIHMIYSSVTGQERDSWFSSTGWGLILFSIGVSLDGFSVGLSLGLFAVNTWLTSIIFGLFGVGMTAIGLLLGRKLGAWIGKYGEVVGGMILLAFGVEFLL
jgi:putative Mn2+ efflux pump MntP